MNKLSFFLLTGLISLASCSSIKSENAIYSFNYEGDSLIDISASTAVNMIKGKMELPLLLYTDSCSYCHTAIEKINQYVTNYHKVIYSLEIFNTSKQYLIEQLPDIFSDNDYYPSLYFFKNNSISYKIVGDELTDFNNIKKIFSSNLLDNKVTYTDTLDQYHDYTSNHLDYSFCLYSSSDISTINYLSELIYKEANDLLIIDKNTAKQELISEINYLFDLGDEENDMYAIYENGQIKTIKRYLTNNGN